MSNFQFNAYPEVLPLYDTEEVVHPTSKAETMESFSFPGHKERQRSMAITWISRSIDGMEQDLDEHEFAKRKIVELFEMKKTLYLSDISKELDIGVSLAEGKSS